MQSPGIKCFEPENYKKYFRSLYWSASRQADRRRRSKSGKTICRNKKHKIGNNLVVCNVPSLLANPSQFSVYAAVRQSVLLKWKHLQSTETSEDSDTDDIAHNVSNVVIPKITVVGLKTVFSLISNAIKVNVAFCEDGLRALLDILQGHSPEDLSQESSDIIQSLNHILVELSSGDNTVPSPITQLSSSCLVSLAVARGEVDTILNTIATLIMVNPELTNQYLMIPDNLTKLQKSVQSSVLGSNCFNTWLEHGVPSESLITSFPIDLAAHSSLGELVVRSMASDGYYLYVLTSKGLFKIGSGYGNSIRQHIHVYKANFFANDRHGWLGHCQDKLYVRVGRKKTEVYEIDKETLEVKRLLNLDVGEPTPIESKSAIFSDGDQLGLVILTNDQSFTFLMYDVNTSESTESRCTIKSNSQIQIPLLRQRTLIIGRAPYDDVVNKKYSNLDNPIGIQLEDRDEDPIVSMATGQDFGLLATASGKVFYTGKLCSLGYRVPNVNTEKWTLMKEVIFNVYELTNSKTKVIQVAVGHEGVHAVLILDNGTALFTGMSRRGEDGDYNKHRRIAPKPTRPKKMNKADGHHIIYAACNYGSTALVTRHGALLMFGKDTQHCDNNGIVTSLRNEKVIQVALGKAHAVALTSSGQVFTFGINNKGQCGRDFLHSRERSNSRRRHTYSKPEIKCALSEHQFTNGQCKVCPACRECTGSPSCKRVSNAERLPRGICGCGDGDSGCTECGVCRRCADCLDSKQPTLEDEMETEDIPNANTSDRDSKSNNDDNLSIVDQEKEANLKLSCLAPSRVNIPGGHRVISISAGLHHTVLLTEQGEVFTFGSNQFGQLGSGDIATHHRIIKVRVPRAAIIAAGSYHTALLTRDGDLYTFGNYQKGQLGRPRLEEAANSDRPPVWFATPGRVPRIGNHTSSKAVWLAASGEQTFVRVSQTLIKTETLFSSTITANSNTIMILPNSPEHGFKCLTIKKTDGSCNSWIGNEQAEFVNSLACLDPLFDVLWCYQPQKKLMKCYNIMAHDSQRTPKCTGIDTTIYALEEEEYINYGSMKRMEEFKSVDEVETLIHKEEKYIDLNELIDVSVLNPDLAMPKSPNCLATRMNVALHLLACLDSLAFARDNKLTQGQLRKKTSVPSTSPGKDEFMTVNRFDGHGGGWGYSGHSVEAIRFMCDSFILLGISPPFLLGGYGLFGGRGDYTAKIRLFDIGMEGGEVEGDGDLIAESDDVVYECAPRDRYPVMFDFPIAIVAHRWYVAWACINGPSSDCGASGQAMVINEQVTFHFKTSKRSNNGTDVNAGQIPCLLYIIAKNDNPMPLMKNIDTIEPIQYLTSNVAHKVTVVSFRSLITLIEWSWNALRGILLETNGHVSINITKLTLMKHQRRLAYIIKACLRLVTSYVNEIYPPVYSDLQLIEFITYYEVIGDVWKLIQKIIADPTPNCAMLQTPVKNKSRCCYVQFAIEISNSILKECHLTIVSCYHAFFSNPQVKWNHLSCLLSHVKDGKVPSSHVREVISTCAAMCSNRSLREVLQYVVPLTQNCLAINEARFQESRTLYPNEVAKSATVLRATHGPKPPPLPPRSRTAHSQKPMEQTEDDSVPSTEWHLLDLVPRLLDIVMYPVEQKMTVRPCALQHDHGEIKENERLVKYCCKLLSRIVSELSHGIANIRDDMEVCSSVKHLVTPSRFMRLNQTRAWNTGNGSPDAISFTVDRPGIMLVGVQVYCGTGSYDFDLDLLHDARQPRAPGEANFDHYWMGLEALQGTYTSHAAHNDIVQLQFERHVPLKENIRYTLKFCNHGGRTVNGDCGLPSVKGPDGTTFRFSSSTFSFNGTSVSRGQMPSLIYYGTSKMSCLSEPTDILLSSLRNITLRVASSVMERTAELFSSLRSKLSVEELCRNAPMLQNSPIVNTLVPYTIASLDGINDSKSVVLILEMVHNLLPQVAAINLLIPSVHEDTVNGGMLTTTGSFYAWVESDHPYKQATTSNVRVLFPSNVSWVVLEFDPRCVTVQPEDTLTVYAAAGSPRNQCNCYDTKQQSETPFKKRVIPLTADSEEIEDVNCEIIKDKPCLHYNCSYVSVTPQLSNIPSEWPQNAIIVPGNEVIFSLQTASNYLNDYNKPNGSDDNRFGYRCLCVGYEDAMFSTQQRQGLLVMEMELAYAGAGCASRLLAPDIDIASLPFSTVMEVQNSSVNGTSPTVVDSSDDGQVDASEAIMLSRGIELSSSPPTIMQVIEGQHLVRSMTTERQFLSDFVSAVENTAGGRLAKWLSPVPCVDPSKCELRMPQVYARPSSKLTLPIILKDQFGEPVRCPAVNIEVQVQQLEDQDIPSTTKPTPSTSHSYGVPDVSYQLTTRDSMRYHAISMMPVFQNFSFEEMRLAFTGWSEQYGIASREGMNGRPPPERLPLLVVVEGDFAAIWMPRAPGTYSLRCYIDGQSVASELVVVVAHGPSESPDPEKQQSSAPSPTSKLLRFIASYSAGLRVRISPSIQAEAIGRIPPGSLVSYVEEISNKDGTWVRLSPESLMAYADATAVVGWCLQYHKHLERALLAPCSPTQSDYIGIWSGQPVLNYLHSNEGSLAQAVSIDEQGVEVVEDLAERMPPLSDPNIPDSPDPFPRRNNGNVEEWWSPHMLRQGEHELISHDPGSHSFRTQASTQTSPETTRPSTSRNDELMDEASNFSPIVGSDRSKKIIKKHSSPPPLPARTYPKAPRKVALSPAQSECLRAIFATLLWHEGIVHDAIACAAYLKFHPHLPKQGERVVTRNPSHEPHPLHRHSLEVTGAGQHFQVEPSELENLTRQGLEASSSRGRHVVATQPINEDEAHSSNYNTEDRLSRSVVNVLPPSLRALVALWDTLTNANQLASATDVKISSEPRRGAVGKGGRDSMYPQGQMVNMGLVDHDDPDAQGSNAGSAPPPTKIRSHPRLRRLNQKLDETSANKSSSKSKKQPSRAPLTVPCELCNGTNVIPPLISHMQHTHVGCKEPTVRGYDETGEYRKTEPSSEITYFCGTLSVGQYQWYIFCEKCREKTIKDYLSKSSKSSDTPPLELPRMRQPAIPDIDYHVLRDNALFLLDLAPLTSSESALPQWLEDSDRNPPVAPNNMWLPAPPFQCLTALGVGPTTRNPDTHGFHSLGRLQNAGSAAYNNIGFDGSLPSTSGSRLQRSVSMDQVGNKAFPFTSRNMRLEEDHDASASLETSSAAGSSLLAQPSASLLRLVGGDEWATGNDMSYAFSAFETPQLDADTLMRRPCLSFMLCKRDLEGFRRKMDAVVRINTVRQHAFEALNWLLRSVTQPICVHDVMWWFCVALEKYNKFAPQLVDDNREHDVRNRTDIASASAICPGDIAARGVRSAFHSFLGSVSSIAPHFPPASACALQAIKCWALNFTQHDRAFLHRSQVFSVISRILSNAEDGLYPEDGLPGGLHDSFNSYSFKENYVWSCVDVTNWCEISTSSRQGMAGALTDGSTETFWESGEEDRNKAKWVEVAYQGGANNNRPHILCLHIDNTRDTMNKTVLVSFLYNGETGDFVHMQDMDVDLKNAAWLCYSLPKGSSQSAQVRCELRGPDPSVRVRQIRVLSCPTLAPSSLQHAPPSMCLHAVTEAETLRVFRLLTTQIFGKLLDWSSEPDIEESGALPVENDSDLREHVVGILFAGRKLTSLQKQVMSHIVLAIGSEAVRVRDDWESVYVSGDMMEEDDDDSEEGYSVRVNSTHCQDNYCFEMLSLLQALSGSATGLTHLAQRTELMADLLALLHTGTERVQRQIISLFRRMIPVISPEKMLAAINYGMDPSTRVTLMEHLVSFLGKAITIQVKVKGVSGTSSGYVMMGAKVASLLPEYWFMRGQTTKDHAQIVANLVSDMAENKLSVAWGEEARNSLANYIVKLSQLPEQEREANNSIASPGFWLALSALAVCDESYMSLISDVRSKENCEIETERPFCINHDDNVTVAIMVCRVCGPLCTECDRFLHLNRTARTHQRKICKEEERAIRIDIHEGCARAKLFWLLLLVDRRTLKGLAEFRSPETTQELVSSGDTYSAVSSGPVRLIGVCRFCGATSNSGLLAVGNVCADPQCQEHGKQVCTRVLVCGHICGGVRGERNCLPCLYGCSNIVDGTPLRQDADDMCMICFTDPLQAAPAIQLHCGHVFHLHCCKNVLANKWNGPRITFTFSQCPICKEDIIHWTLEELLAPIRKLRSEVRRKALMRLEYEGMDDAASARARFSPEEYAMEKYAYYVCHKCGKAYFGGMARCEADMNGAWQEAELVCGACSDTTGANICPKHGSDFLEYKCRYCCSVAVFFCFGNSHFCNACHDDFQRVTNLPKPQLPHCPAGPKGEQLPGTSEECPLHIEHPATGEEFALGCGICRNAHHF